MSSTRTAARHPAAATVAIDRVICGVDGSRTDPEAVRQAAILAGQAGLLDLVCVAGNDGVHPASAATLSSERAERVLDDARTMAAEAGVDASTRIVHDPDRWDGLARAAAGHDLLVLGRHERSRAEGILGGSVATEALHRSAIPVLVACACAAPFPERVLLATDGSDDSRRAAAFATLICSRFGAEATVLTVGPDAERTRRHEMAQETADIFRASGVEPVIALRDGSPSAAIVQLAAELDPALVVVGSGGKAGLRALGSVSEHVAHEVSCSALVARPPAGTSADTSRALRKGGVAAREAPTAT